MSSVDERLIAYHEIGHALAFQCLGIEFIFVTANCDDRAVTPSATGFDTLRRNPVKKLLAVLAGPAAECAMASKLLPEFDFWAYADRNWDEGWSSDVDQATAAAPELQSGFRRLVLYLNDLFSRPVAEVGEGLAPKLLSLKSMMSAQEVRAVFDRHNDSIRTLEKALTSLVEKLKRGDQSFLG